MELYSFVSAINQQSSKKSVLEVSQRLTISLVLLNFIFCFGIFCGTPCQYVAYKWYCCGLDDTTEHSWKIIHFAVSFLALNMLCRFKVAFCTFWMAPPCSSQLSGQLAMLTCWSRRERSSSFLSYFFFLMSPGRELWLLMHVLHPWPGIWLALLNSHMC